MMMTDQRIETSSFCSSMASFFESLRARRNIFFVIVGFLVIFSSWHFLVSSFALLPEIRGCSACDHDPPPNWDKLYKWEDDLPQHNVDLPFPEGNEGRYVYFANHIHGLGWNNVLNEMCAFLFTL
jgi:hypothetical protein